MHSRIIYARCVYNGDHGDGGVDGDGDNNREVNLLYVQCITIRRAVFTARVVMSEHCLSSVCDKLHCDQAVRDTLILAQEHY